VLASNPNYLFTHFKLKIMKKFSMGFLFIVACVIFIFSRCDQGKTDKTTQKDSVQTTVAENGSFESQVKWGEHIVTIAGCHDCHTPKKMGPNGPEDNMDIALSGHPAGMPDMNTNRKEIESKGLILTNLTQWVGPWGVSYTANLTSDTTTGIGNWTEDQFIYCLRNGKYMGLPEGRTLLPPMPWQSIGKMTDDELKAVFAYLQSTEPIHNIVPQPQPPVP
jgi:mono/diheme cytochrome c family protein